MPDHKKIAKLLIEEYIKLRHIFIKYFFPASSRSWSRLTYLARNTVKLVQQLRGLLDRSTARYFYKGSETNLHKLISKSRDNIF
jgi:hypothetical protein